VTDYKRLDSKPQHEVPKSPYQQPVMIFTAACYASRQEIFFLILDVVLNIVIKENMTSCEGPYAILFGTTKCLLRVCVCTPSSSRRGAREARENPPGEASA